MEIRLMKNTLEGKQLAMLVTMREMENLVIVPSLTVGSYVDIYLSIESI